METAIGKLRKLWTAGEHRKALGLAATWPQLGEHKEAIQRGWAAAAHPRFYIELGMDPDAIYSAGLAALIERYELTPPQETSK